MTIETDILAQITDLLGRRTLTQEEIRAWWAGAADGGPEGNGMFPVTDGSGYVRSLPAPSKIIEDFTTAPAIALEVLRPATDTSPVVLNGIAYADSFPGVVHGPLANYEARIANGAAIQAFLAWCVANNAGAKFGPYLYEYISEQTEGGRNTGLQVPFALRMFEGTVSGSDDGTQFRQFAVNHPALTLGSIVNDPNNYAYSWRVGDFMCGFGASQAGQQQAIALLVGMACFGNMYRMTAADHNNFGYFDPWISASFGLPDRSTGPFFSMSVTGFCKFGGGQYCSFSHSAPGTGNSFEHIYCGGGSPHNRTVCQVSPVNIDLVTTQAWGTITQLNIEWFDIQFGGPLSVNASGVVIHTIHIEGNKQQGFDPVCIGCSGQLQIGTMQWVDNYILPNQGSRYSMFSVYAEPTASIYVNTLEMVLSGQEPTNGSCYMPIILVKEFFGTAPPADAPKASWNGRIYIEMAYSDSMAGLAPDCYIWDNFSTVGALFGLGRPPHPTEEGYILSWEGVDGRPVWPMPLKACTINYKAVGTPQIWGFYGNARIHIQGPVLNDAVIQMKDIQNYINAVPRQIGSVVTISRQDDGPGKIDIVTDALYPAEPQLIHSFAGGASQAHIVVLNWTGTSWLVHAYP
jgi:hypothetical protein